MVMNDSGARVSRSSTTMSNATVAASNSNNNSNEADNCEMSPHHYCMRSILPLLFL